MLLNLGMSGRGWDRHSRREGLIAYCTIEPCQRIEW